MDEFVNGDFQRNQILNKFANQNRCKKNDNNNNNRNNKSLFSGFLKFSKALKKYAFSFMSKEGK